MWGGDLKRVGFVLFALAKLLSAIREISAATYQSGVPSKFAEIPVHVNDFTCAIFIGTVIP